MFWFVLFKVAAFGWIRKRNENVSYIYVWCIFYKCKMLDWKYHTFLSYFLCYSCCTSGKSAAFCGYWMVFIHVCHFLEHFVCPFLRDSDFMDDVHLCDLFFSTDDDVVAEVFYVFSLYFLLYFFMFLLISLEEAFLYQIHICKFSVIVSVRNGKFITFQIPQAQRICI